MSMCARIFALVLTCGMPAAMCLAQESRGAASAPGAGHPTTYGAASITTRYTTRPVLRPIPLERPSTALPSGGLPAGTGVRASGSAYTPGSYAARPLATTNSQPRTAASPATTAPTKSRRLIFTTTDHVEINHADVYQFNREKNQHVFTGNVDMVSGENNLTSDKLTIVTDEKDQLLSITVEGNVVIVQVTEKGKRRAYGDFGKYLAADDRFVLVGTPWVRLVDEQSEIIAKKVIFYNESGRVEMENVNNWRLKMAGKPATAGAATALPGAAPAPSATGAPAVPHVVPRTP